MQYADRWSNELLEEAHAGVVVSPRIIEGGSQGGPPEMKPVVGWVALDEAVEEVCSFLRKRFDEGRRYAIVAVAEGAMDPEIARHVMHSAEKDAFGHVQLGTGIGIGEALANEIEDRTGLETRHVILGHVQRGGPPSAFDRVLGTMLGVKVVEMAEEGLSGQMAALRGGEVVSASLKEAVGKLKTVPAERYERAEIFFD